MTSIQLIMTLVNTSIDKKIFNLDFMTVVAAVLIPVVDCCKIGMLHY